ncbi:hypothetical protein VSS74_00310 [Conexibacter stalactiti]|uniref:SnoaL-like domain-containing protein n=1 Tax=Conexibacter stalactiti TaxID=1940611 RepID=A0ABU4HHH8_9ACTN|nr:hypothetical protein [Conexibacter stalactiti]MDW5592757.1 hypothetical protein [Conexibacter stalactiti]MEC5033398.1 hypothetical protein [Conexibacter stalactiti]
MQHVRRLSLLLAVVVAGLLCPTAPVGARQDPGAVLHQFVAAMNAPSSGAPKCALLAADVLELAAAPEWAGLDARLPTSHTRDAAIRGCDAVAKMWKTIRLGGADWRRAKVGVTVLRAPGGDAAHLSARVRFARGPRPRLRGIDVLLVREQGSWRIISAPDLLDLWAGPAGAPRTLAQLPRHRRWLARAAREHRERAQRRVRRYLATRAPALAVPLPWSGTASRVADAVGDPRTELGDGMERAPGAVADLVEAALATDGGTTTLDLRFAAPLLPNLAFELRLGQQSGRQRAEERLVGDLSDGWVSVARRDGAGRETMLGGVTASAAGDLLRVAFAPGVVRRGFADGEELRWSVVVTTPPTPPRLLAEVWSDWAPEPSPNGAPDGVSHRP